MSVYVSAMDALDFAGTFSDGSIALLAVDPPYGQIVDEDWDRSWSDAEDYALWLTDVFHAYYPKLTQDGSLVFFGAIGSHGHRPMWETMKRLDAAGLYRYRNSVTWKKRRSYGKSHDYLFCREEFAWYSKSPNRTEVRFNVPYTDVERGYEGFDSRYPAKSKYKRVSNVWDDIPELMRPKRRCQKPLPLLSRIVSTHSHPDDLVVDCFAGWGTTGIVCAQTGRRFRGCEKIPEVADAANRRVAEVYGAVES